MVSAPARRVPASEDELASLKRGDLVLVTFNTESPKKIMVYEGLDEQGRDSFLIGSDSFLLSPRGTMLSWRSHRKYLQFDDENGVIFNHLYRTLEIYDENTKAKTFYRAQNLLRQSSQGGQQ